MSVYNYNHKGFFSQAVNMKKGNIGNVNVKKTKQKQLSVNQKQCVGRYSIGKTQRRLNITGIC